MVRYCLEEYFPQTLAKIKRKPEQYITPVDQQRYPSDTDRYVLDSLQNPMVLLDVNADSQYLLDTIVKVARRTGKYIVDPTNMQLAHRSLYDVLTGPRATAYIHSSVLELMHRRYGEGTHPHIKKVFIDFEPHLNPEQLQLLIQTLLFKIPYKSYSGDDRTLDIVFNTSAQPDPISMVQEICTDHGLTREENHEDLIRAVVQANF